MIIDFSVDNFKNKAINSSIFSRKSSFKAFQKALDFYSFLLTVSENLLLKLQRLYNPALWIAEAQLCDSVTKVCWDVVKNKIQM